MAKKKDTSDPLTAFASGLTEKYGRATIMTADRVGLPETPRVTSGIFMLDLALGGGWPLGQYALAYGEPQTGKTTLFLNGIANAQRTCGNCFRRAELVPGKVKTLDPNTSQVKLVDSMVVGECECGKPRNLKFAWVDVEEKLNLGWARDHGVILERLFLTKPDYAEQAIDIIDAMIEQSVVDVVVMDSIEHFIPKAEADGSAMDDHVGLRARKFNQALRMWTAKKKKQWKRSVQTGEFHVPTLWMINQIRHKIGVSFGSPETKPAGWGTGFATTVEVRTSGGTKAKTELDNDLMISYAVGHGFRVAKNQAGVANLSGEYKISLLDDGVFHKGQILDHDQVLIHAVVHGLVEKLSKVKYVCNGQEFVGKGKIIDHWVRNPELYEAIKEETLSRALDVQLKKLRDE